MGNYVLSIVPVQCLGEYFVTEWYLCSVFPLVMVIPKRICDQRWSFLVLAMKSKNFCDTDEYKISRKSNRYWGILHIN